MSSNAHLGTVWHNVCQISDLIPNSGVAVRLPTAAAALFWLPATETQVYAIAHRDPRTGVEVLAHGLLCEHGGEWVVASPLYKEKFRLQDGCCVDNPDQRLKTWPVRISGDQVQIQF